MQLEKKYRKYKNKYIKLKKIKEGNDIYFFAQTSSGGGHSIICTKNGDVYVFGSNQFGQLGLGNDEDKFTPTLLMENDSIKQIAC